MSPSRPRASACAVVTSIAAQINGAVTVGPSNGGARFTLEFPLSANARHRTA